MTTAQLSETRRHSRARRPANRVRRPPGEPRGRPPGWSRRPAAARRIDVRLAAAPAGTTRVDVARDVWRENLPSTERELAVPGLALFTYRVAGALRQAQGTASLHELLEAGVLVPEPIVYEDFLPRSTAGIFQSNLTEEASGTTTCSARRTTSTRWAR